MPKTPKHILVIRLSALGDVAMTIPVLRAFIKQYPDIKVTVLTQANFSPLFRDLKNVMVFSADVQGKHKGVLGLYKLYKSLKRLNIDAVADLHNVLRTKILKLFFFRTRFIQIDKGRADKKALTSGKLFTQLITTHQRYADVFKLLGFTVNLPNPEFPMRVSLNDKILKIVKKDTQKWIGIAPFAAYASKMYPLDLMEDAIETLSNSHKIILFGSSNEMNTLEALEHKFENVFSVAGKLSLDEELNLISNLDIMLSMDSANGHLAAMLGIKVITIWGVTHPFAGFTPFNQPETHALLTNKDQFPLIPTSVYGNRYPKGYKEVSRSISPETVVKKIESII